MKFVLWDLNDRIVGFAKSATIDTNEFFPPGVLNFDEVNCFEIVDG